MIFITWIPFSRSSHPEAFCKKGVFRNFTELTEKLSHFFYKVAGVRPATLFKTLTHVFSCEFCEIFKNTFFTEHLWWLFLCFSHPTWNICLQKHLHICNSSFSSFDVLFLQLSCTFKKTRLQKLSLLRFEHDWNIKGKLFNSLIIDKEVTILEWNGGFSWKINL